MQGQDRTDAAANIGQHKRSTFGITVHLYMLLVATGLLPLLVVGTLMVSASVRAMSRSVRELQLSVVSDVSHTVRRDLALSRLELNAMAELLLGDGYGDDARRIDLVSARLSASERLEWLSVYAPSGEHLGTLKAEGTRDPEVVSRLPESMLAQLEGQEFLVDKVVDGGAYPVLTIGTRLMVNEALRGYVLAGTSLRPLCSVLADISEERFGGGKNLVYLVDDTLRLVAHPEEKRASLRENRGDSDVFRSLGGNCSFDTPFGVAPDFKDARGKKWLAAIESIPEFGWAVVVELDRDLAFGSVSQMRQTMLLGALATALAVIALAVFVARRVTRPVLALEAGTRKLANREFGTRVKVRTNDEIGNLARSFNWMARSLQESEEKLIAEARIRNDLSRYLSPEVVEEIIHHPERMQLGGERRVVTIMFADIVGFTSLSEQMDPESIVSILNELFTFATEIILRRSGIIDKFIGDCIMAVFGAPEAGPDDAENAVEAAEDLQRWLEVGNRRWRKMYNIELQMAIGINTGSVIAGNIGSEKRMEYTVIGDAVNVAARLESLAEAGQVLISKATRDVIGNRFDCELAGLEELKGRTGATTIYVISPE